MEARAFCPGHISTFFVPRGGRDTTDPHIGSLGSGFSIEEGVTTRVEVEGTLRALRKGANPLQFTVEDNGLPRQETGLTFFMISNLEALALRGNKPGPLPRRIFIENTYNLPLGAGFGMSGGVALAGALALNEAAQLGASRDDCVAAAHMAEVSELTGLGDVTGQSVGGFEIRVRVGPPPHGEVLTPPYADTPVAVASFGPRITSDFLKADAGKKTVQEAGLRCLEALRKEPTLAASTRLGRTFAEELGLVSPDAQALMDALGPEVPASIAMLGDTVFALGGGPVASKVRAEAAGAFVATTSTSRAPARLL